MIPTMLFVGLAAGRWWAIPLGGFAWATLMVIAVPISAADLPRAVALGAANVAVGVLVRWIVARLLRRVTALAPPA